MYHVVPDRPIARRPIVFVPGWGTNPPGWFDFYKAVHGRAELYYLETREKASSRILDRRTDMSVRQAARDISRALDTLGFARRDFVLAAACWGAAQVLQGMIDGHLRAPTVLLQDPMHRLWFSRWILRWVSPLVPLPLLHVLRPIFAKALLGDMKEPVQKARAYAFVYGADFWKWKKSAEAAKDFELHGALAGVRDEVFVLNGTADKVHDPVALPPHRRRAAPEAGSCSPRRSRAGASCCSARSPSSSRRCGRGRRAPVAREVRAARAVAAPEIRRFSGAPA